MMNLKTITFFSFCCTALLLACKHDPEIVQPTPCNTTFAFSADILPIIETNCTSCHSGSDPDGGLLLVNNSDIQDAADDGELWERINDSENPMPPSPSDELSDCNKNQIQSWIEADMPNN
jgi:uncharacterized membrane protein